MVRNIVGTLVEIGLGRRPAAWTLDVLGSRDRQTAGPTAPAHGLYLLRVRYAESIFPGGRHLGMARRLPKTAGPSPVTKPSYPPP